MNLRDDVFRKYILNITVIFNIGSDMKDPLYSQSLHTHVSSILFLPFELDLMSTVQFKFFQCRAASMLKVELQAYEIIVAGTFFGVAGEMRRLPACFDNGNKMFDFPT